MSTGAGQNKRDANRRALLGSRAGMLLDWSDVDKAMMIAAIPLPFLLVSLFRVRVILANTADEPYLSRPTLAFIVYCVAFYHAAFAILGSVWWLVRTRRPDSKVFVFAALVLAFIAGSGSAYVVGHFTTPILGAAVAGSMAVLLLFELRIAMPMLAFGFVTLFGPIVPVALRIIPYGPLYESLPFVTASPPTPWLMTVTAAGMAIVVAPTLLLLVVVGRWRARDAEIHRLAKLDGLTEVPNRRYFLDRLHEEIARATRFGGSVSLILFDLDHFKRINDKHGHQVGDAVLVEVAQLVQSTVLRRIDVVGRYGGEEFAVMLPETDEEGALVVAERLRAAIEDCEVIRGAVRVRVTSSFGVATFPRTDVLDLDALVSRADGALYRAKDQGRNRVETEPLEDRVTVPPRA